MPSKRNSAKALFNFSTVLTTSPMIQRLTASSAFGALTLGLKFQIKVQNDVMMDFKVDRYQQRTAWHLKTPGSNGLPLFNASFYQIGIYKTF